MVSPGTAGALPVLATVREAYAIWFTHTGLWLRLSAVPVVCLVVLGALVPQTAIPGTTQVDIPLGVLSFAAFMIYFLSAVPLATAWHRLILLPADFSAARYSVGRAEWLYLKKIVLLMLIWIAVGFGISLIGLLLGGVSAAVLAGLSGSAVAPAVVLGVISFAVIAIAAYLFGPVVLVLPAAAVGRWMSVGEASNAIGASRWSLVGLYILAYFPVWLLTTILELGVPIYAGGIPDFAGVVLRYLPELIFTPVIVGILSITYRERVQAPEASGSAGEAPVSGP